MNDYYIEQSTVQVSKAGQNVCGDHQMVIRSPEGTIAVLCDGIGSGVYANIAAITSAHRLTALLEDGVPIQEACGRVADSMHRARTEDIPYSAFTAVRVRSSGQFTAMTYDAPAPVLIRSGHAYLAEQQYRTLGYELVAETTGTLQEGDALGIFSDGVSQAGIGRTHALGWGSEGVTAFANRQLSRIQDPGALPSSVIRETERLCGGTHPDDATFTLLSCRSARIVNLMTGPPSSRRFDQSFVERFQAAPGLHIVCGSSTADMVSRILDRPVQALPFQSSMARPPAYRMDGMDLVTEGAATLNQAYNILDEDPDSYDSESSVTRLATMLRDADLIHFHVGDAQNTGHESITFKQLGVQSRRTIVAMLVRKLTAMGKLVTVSNV